MGVAEAAGRGKTSQRRRLSVAYTIEELRAEIRGMSAIEFARWVNRHPELFEDLAKEIN